MPEQLLVLAEDERSLWPLLAGGEGWEGHSCLSVLRCGRSDFPGGLAAVAEHPSPHPQEVGDSPLGRPQTQVAFIQTDLTSKLTITSCTNLDGLFKFVISVNLFSYRGKEVNGS